jgi:hypothetical protein
MAAKKKVVKKKVRTQEDIKLITFLNKVARMCRDCHEVGSPLTHEVVEMESMLWRFADDRGYNREHFYGDFE